MQLTADRPHEKHETHVDDPKAFHELPIDKQQIIRTWIRNSVEPHRAKKYNGISSYWLKHWFEYQLRGFYITNGQMKGGLLAEGFIPKDERNQNWTFTLSNKLMRVDFSKCDRWLRD